MAEETTRPLIVGPDSGPEAPFPLKMEGKVISGFGRGSKELGIPTANLPVDASQTPWIDTTKSGVYFGWASLSLPASHPDRVAPPPSSGSGPAQPHLEFQLYPMVMSIGYNPFYKNTVRSAEVHVLHKFSADFYDAHMRLLILGFVREEKDYKSLEALVADINTDCDVARNSLDREGWAPPKALRPGAERDGVLDAKWLVEPLPKA
ncbi:riboflavin kinase [Colletotrichum incanum]|uniref:Riboflavin kinase n=1 Tax=Colletotrichum incanum TaxID=1573173 RepID=A0A161Y0X3_COLIC|nr:riboflavin kinase [Colletotrichum incanum]OHX01270.1 riboflavin kinase [Colletotrichum incanum]